MYKVNTHVMVYWCKVNSCEYSKNLLTVGTGVLHALSWSVCQNDTNLPTMYTAYCESDTGSIQIETASTSEKIILSHQCIRPDLVLPLLNDYFNFITVLAMLYDLRIDNSDNYRYYNYIKDRIYSCCLSMISIGIE